MRKHAYIELIVDTELDRSSARNWLATVKSTLPSGLSAETEIRINGNPKNSDFYVSKLDGRVHYVVPLSRDPNLAEVQSVALAWNNSYTEGDFEIDYSSAGSAAAISKEVKEVGLKEIAMEAAKLNHNEWMKTMSDSGWSYGIKFDQKNKRNPVLRPWDQLSPRYRLQELQRFEKLMEVLDRMNLRLTRNK